MTRVDGRIVTAALATAVRPMLRSAGFTVFRGRTAWRVTDETIDRVAFESMNAAVAAGVGCTTFSFGGRAGIFYRALVGDDVRPPVPGNPTFSAMLTKSLAQPLFHPWGRVEPTDREDVWFVEADGGNLDAVVSDAASVLRDRALPWLSTLTASGDALRRLREVRGGMDPATALRIDGPGRPGSPAWSDAVAALTARLGGEHPAPDDAPVLTPAERWLLRHRRDTEGGDPSVVAARIERDGLRMSRHDVPLRHGSAHPEAPDLLHLYVGSDGSLLAIRLW